MVPICISKNEESDIWSNLERQNSNLNVKRRYLTIILKEKYKKTIFGQILNVRLGF